jgi:hypothetical protein
MNKRFIAGLAGFALLLIIGVSEASAVETDQTKKVNVQPGATGVHDISISQSKVSVHDLSVPAVKIVTPTDHKIDVAGALSPTDHKVDAPVGVHDKAFDVFHKHKGEIKAAFGKAEIMDLEPPPPARGETGIIGPIDSHIDGPDELQHKGEAGFDVFHKGETQGILIGMHKGEGEAGAVDAFHKTEAESGAVVGMPDEGTADFEPPVAP